MFKNNFYKILLIASILIGSLSTYAKAPTPQPNFAILLSQPRHVKSSIEILLSTKKDKNKIQYNEARIVLYSDAIHEVKKDSSLKEIIIKANKNNIKIVVCNHALKRQNVNAKDLLPNIEIVDNAIYEMLRLKTQGYITLDM